MRRRVAVAAGVVVVTMVIPFHLAALLVGGQWDWAAGLSVGALITFVVAILDSPPAHIEQWRTGAQGEKSTAKMLRRLPADWRVRHDLPWGQATLTTW